MRTLSEAWPAPPFEGFSADALAFLRELSTHLDKAWFDAHKARYERSVRDPLQALVSALDEGLQAAGLPFRGDPKRSVFRINRDVRFSRDKSPYKTNAGCALTRDGEKLSPGVLYFHLDPRGCFVAAGFYAPEPSALHSLRLGLMDDPVGWTATTAALAEAGLVLAGDDTLVRPPKGFDPAPAAVTEALKLKSWVVSRPIPEAALAAPSLASTLVAFAQSAEPLLRYGWRALDERPPERRAR